MYENATQRKLDKDLKAHLLSLVFTGHLLLNRQLSTPSPDRQTEKRKEKKSLFIFEVEVHFLLDSLLMGHRI